MGKITLLKKPQILDMRKKLLKVTTHIHAILNTVRVLAYCFSRDARRFISSESSLVATTYRSGRMRKQDGLRNINITHFRFLPLKLKYATCSIVYSLERKSTMTPFQTFNIGIVLSFLKVQNVF